jgi:hypothetical protein
MGDLRIDSFGLPESPGGQPKDGSKKRPKPTPVEPQEEPIDQVTLSSAVESDTEPTGYSPAPSDEEPE